MRESHVKKIAVLISVVGLIILYLISFTISGTTSISDITIEDVGRTVKVCGNVTSFRNSNNHIFFTLDDGNRINAVIFNSTALQLNQSGSNPYQLGVGDLLCVPGVVEEYPKNSGQLEIIYRAGVIERIV